MTGQIEQYLEQEIASMKQQLAEAKKDAERMREALADMLSGWKYIRETHGDLYGVGWDRAQQKAEEAMREGE